MVCQAGAYVDARAKHDLTQLHLAAEHGIPEMVNALINAGADIEARTEDGRTPLYMGRTYERNGKVSQGLFFAEAPIAGRWNTAGFSQSRHLIFQRLVCCGGPCVPYLRMTHSLTVRNILQKTFVSHICFSKSFPCFSYEGTLLTSAP